jgi:RNA polymerase sigma-70 factor (ECF subfamily)
MSFDDPLSGPAVMAVLVSDPSALHAHAEAAPLDDDSDEALMARIAEADQAAFRMFARRHVSRSLAVAQRICGNAPDAEEIVQDAMLRVWQRAGEWRFGDARVTTWLYRVVVNLAIDHIRRNRQRFVSIDEVGDPVDPTPDAEMLAEGRQLEMLMNAAIARLPTRQRVALTLCYFEAMDCAEAARIMQISVSAMESLLVRGRRTLRAQLDRLGEQNRMGAANVVRLRRRPEAAPLERSQARLEAPFSWAFAAQA